MSISHKSSNTQIFRLMLYHRALHPELFDLEVRRCHSQPEYEVESWVVPAGHIVRFQVDGCCLTEAVLEDGDHLPETGLVHALPCLGEKDYEMDPKDGRIGYVTTIQTETLTDNLYAATLREMRDFAAETSALSHEWKNPEGSSCLSILDYQKYKREFHIQSYHLLGGSGLVLRTQSIFEAL
jgi:hypothetical protein